MQQLRRSLRLRLQADLLRVLRSVPTPPSTIPAEARGGVPVAPDALPVCVSATEQADKINKSHPGPCGERGRGESDCDLLRGGVKKTSVRGARAVLLMGK